MNTRIYNQSYLCFPFLHVRSYRYFAIFSTLPTALFQLRCTRPELWSRQSHWGGHQHEFSRRSAAIGRFYAADGDFRYEKLPFSFFFFIPSLSLYRSFEFNISIHSQVGRAGNSLRRSGWHFFIRSTLPVTAFPPRKKMSNSCHPLWAIFPSTSCPFTHSFPFWCSSYHGWTASTTKGIINCCHNSCVPGMNKELGKVYLRHKDQGFYEEKLTERFSSF